LSFKNVKLIFVNLIIKSESTFCNK